MNIFIETTDLRNKHLLSLLSNMKPNVLELNETTISKVNTSDLLVFSPAKKFDELELSNLPNNINIICGNVTESVSQTFITKNITHYNVISDEEFAIKNANLTCEGVLCLILQNSAKSIYKNNILILGSGRIAKSLGILLSKIGANFDYLYYKDYGFETYALYGKNRFLKNDFISIIKNYDIVINTIPAEILNSEAIKSIETETLFIETASTQCLNENLATHFTYLKAPALPQKFSHITASEVLLEYVLKIIEK